MRVEKIIKQKIFQVTSIILLIGLIPTLFIVYMDLTTTVATYYIVGYVIFLSIYFIASIILCLYLFTKLNKTELIGMIKNFFMSFIVLSVLYTIASIVFHLSFEVDQLYMILGLSLGTTMVRMLYREK